jgi:hypothetical protein
MTMCQRCTAHIQPEMIDVPGAKPVKYSRGSGTLGHLKERICQHVRPDAGGAPCLLRQMDQYRSTILEP